MKKKYSWNLSDGRQVTLEAECITTMIADSVYADGHEVGFKKKPFAKGNLTAYIDGKKFDSCCDTGFWNTIDVYGRPGIKKIWGIKGIGFTKDRAAEIDSFLQSVIEEGKTEEVRAYEVEKAVREKAEYKQSLENFLAEAAKHKLYTAEEAERARKNWINIVNEGGSGYVPHFYTFEEVESAKRELAEIND